MNENQSINASSYHLHSITHRSIHSCIQSFISFIPSFAHSFIHRFIRSFLHSFAHRSSIQSFMQSLMHCIHSLISLSRFMPVIAAKLRPSSGQLVRPRVGGCASAGQIVRPTLGGGRPQALPGCSRRVTMRQFFLWVIGGHRPQALPGLKRARGLSQCSTICPEEVQPPTLGLTSWPTGQD